MESLRINEGSEPSYIDHPTLGAYLLYATGFRILHSMEIVPFENLQQFFDADDPIVRLPQVYFAGRILTCIFAVCTAIFLGLSLWLWSQAMWPAWIGAGFALLSYGLLLHGMIIRTEMCAMFFAFAAFAALAFSRTRAATTRLMWTLLAGLLMGFGVMAKVMVLPLLAVCAVLVVLALWYDRCDLSDKKIPIWYQLVCIALAIFLYWYFTMFLAKEVIVETRLKSILTLLGILSLLSVGLVKWNTRFGRYWISLQSLTLGYLCATPLLFTFCHIERSWSQFYIVNTVFSMMHFSSQSPLRLAHSWGNTSDFVKWFLMFLKFSALESYLAWPALISLFLAKAWRNRVLIVLAIGSSVGMAFVSSARYFGDQYLLFQELLLALAIGVGLIDVFQHRMSRLQSKISWTLAVWLLMAGLSLKNRAVAENYYPHYNANLRDRLHAVGECIFRVGEFYQKMLAIYSSREAIMNRVLDDPRLNGSDQGIDILALANVQKDIESYLTEKISDTDP